MSRDKQAYQQNSQNEQQRLKDRQGVEQKQNQDSIGLMVHAYNNFLSGMMGFNELALLECEQSEVEERLQMALSSGKKAVIFGKELLSSISRLQVVISPVEILSTLKSVSSESKCPIDIQIDEKMLFVNAETEWFKHCLTSLVGFCRDYLASHHSSQDKSDTQNFDGGDIEMSVLRQDDELIITVNSTELSFDEEQQENLFVPFYSSRNLLGQKDVGLAMIKGFLIQIKGTFEWQEDKGFLLKMPVVELGTD
ncbi:sensor histidine kinase [Aliikangiella coralliicola]|uniref:HAMP domain-containing histidine kinase n=1 Tax=Aliikangiella coralliicola TaxID=2592383 RepID=A0A545U513_9GAMM|nr:HAMP domain-containing histidine kinase [Aliikangiella coralliicola]TQV84558.1 HAMP domain-containing histidine kinase [Aliikangiella coralliicola]